MAKNNQMPIVLNDAVWDRYVKGRKINDAISDVFGDFINERINAVPALANMTPFQMVMHDAKINKDSVLQDMINAVSNSAYTSGGMDTNQWLFPAWVETSLQEAIYDQSILPYLVSTRIGIEGNTVQSAMLDLMDPENKKAIMKSRIAEGADIPSRKITIGERAITLWKHGCAIELTYESIRREKIELFNIHMRAISGGLAHQEEDEALDVAIRGDGNNNAAQSLGAVATSGQVSASDLINAVFDYYDANNYYPDTLILPQKYYLEASQMTFDPTLALGASLNLTFNTPQTSKKSITMLRKKDLKVNNKDVFVLMNRQYSLVRYEENGSNIQEIDKFIRNQTTLRTLTENSGYAVPVNGATRYVEIKGA